MKRSYLQVTLLAVALLALVVGSAGNAVASGPMQATPAATQAAAAGGGVAAMMALPEKKAAGEPISVGAIFDLTGATADVGKIYAEGVLAYVDWLNNHGGIKDRPIQLSNADYAYKVPESEKLYTQYVTQNKVVTFMGWGTGDTLALVSKIAEDKIPFGSASYSADLNDPKGKAPYNFLIGATYSDQAVVLLDFFVKQAKDSKPKIAFLHNDSPFGLSPLGDAEAYLKSAGGLESIRVPMPAGATDFTAQIAQVKQFGATHVIFQNTTSAPARFINQAVSQNLKVTWGCLNWCADEGFIKLAAKNAEGVYGAIPFAPPTLDVPGVQLVRQYTKAKNVNLDEKGLHYVQGWWAMTILLEGVKRTVEAGKPLTGPNIKEALESVKDFDTGGVTPPVTFTPDDHRATRSLKVYVVKDGKWAAASEFLKAPGAK